jgi:phosphatidylglycerophosphatase A
MSDSSTSPPAAPKKDRGKLFLVLATGAGAGYVPFIPGTIGSLWGIPLVWVMQWLFRSKTPAYSATAAYAAVTAGLLVAGWFICRAALKRVEGKDPKQIVIDEIVALPIVFLFVPIEFWPWKSSTAVIGFFWFRLFDIVKPWPIRELEKFPGALGVMIDDVAAAVYAFAALLASVTVLNSLYGAG